MIKIEKIVLKRTWPNAFAPQVHSSPPLPTSSEWPRPHAAWTKRVPFGALSCWGVTWRGAFSEISSTLETPNAHDVLRPNIHAVPSVSKAMQWQAHGELWMEIICTFAKERKIWGCKRSGLWNGVRLFLNDKSNVKHVLNVPPVLFRRNAGLFFFP